MSRYIYSFLVFFIFWVAFTTSLHPDELIVGAVIAFIMAFYTGKQFSEDGLKNLTLRKIVFSVRYLFVFIWEMIKANVDVALLVLNPKMPINPGIVEVPTKLKSNTAKLALANSITLTPGTLSVDIVEDKLYIHWINVTTTNPEKAFEQISAVFEKYIKEIFE